MGSCGSRETGGLRIIYYFISPPGRVYMMNIYAKSRQTDLSESDLKLLDALAVQIKRIERKGH